MANNEIDHPADPESNIDNYRRKCSYKISEFKTIIKNNDSFRGDPVFQCDAVIKNEDVQISAEFRGSSFNEDKKEVKFQGPSIFSTCKITKLKAEDYDREFGYIQTSKRLHENEFEKAIEISDFHANLLHNQDEVLDSDGVNNPFYSTKSYCKVPAGQTETSQIELTDKPGGYIPKDSDNQTEIKETSKVELTDNPGCDVPKDSDNQSSEKSSNHKWGGLQKHVRYQQFFVYLVMRSKMDNGEWKYDDPLFSFDWFIYLKWIKVSGKNNNIFEYNCGLNEHTTTRELPDWISSNEFYACNDDQFSYWIDKSNCKFYIYSYPKSISKNYLERIYDKMEDMVSKEKTGFEKLKIRISNAINFFGNNEIGDSEDENDERIENMSRGKKESLENTKSIVLKLKKSAEKMFSIEKNVYEDIASLLPKVKKLCEILEKMDLEKIKFLENTTRIDKEGWKLDNCTEIMNSIEELGEGIESLRGKVESLSNNSKSPLLKLEKLSKGIEIADLKNFTNIKLEVRKLYNCIEQMDSRELDVYKHFKSLIPKIDNLATDVGKMNLEKKQSSGNITSTDEELRESLPITESVDWKELKVIESIDFGRYKFCKCRFLKEENNLLNKIKKAILERNNKEQIDQNKQSIAKSNETLVEQNN